MRRDKIALLAKALKISPVTLITGEDIDTKIDLPKNILPLKKVRYVPVIGRIACGTPILAEENIIDRILLPDHIKADFALQAFGDSMTCAQIDDQDYVYIRSQPEVENGEIAAVLIGEEATLKKVYREDDKLTLLPANPKHEPFVYIKDEIKQVRIIGKAVAVLKNLE
jgi:repressor LexA